MIIGSKELLDVEVETTNVFFLKIATTMIPITASAHKKIMHISSQSLIRAQVKYLSMLSDF